ncbi:hypothetical protein ATCC90586_009874 [Pythium insidiosum]|nr:hypothetical protein ATCC90586_009874 [Pythium insidiosum]
MSVDSAPTTTRRRLAAKRRAQAQPYERRTPKRSTDDDNDWLEMDNADTTAKHRPASAGLFSRLFSFLPIVGKLVADQDAAEPLADERMEDTSLSDDERDASDEGGHGNDNTMDNEDDASTEQEENDDVVIDEPVSNVFELHVETDTPSQQKDVV